MAAVLAHEDVRRNGVRYPGTGLPVSGTLMRARTEPQADTRRASASKSVGASGVHYVKKSGRKSLDSAMQLGPRDEAEAEAPGDEAGTSSSAAPSAALVAAVQKAAKAAKPETLNFSPALSNRTMHSPFLVPEELPEGLVGRRRWASMTEEEMMTGIRRSSKEMHPVDLAAYPSPGMSPTLAPTWRVGRDAADTYGPGARRRWASLSDDEAASPMLWPMRSPALHVQRPGRRSQSNTPLLGPAGMGLAKVSEHAECEDFMLPPTPPVATPSDRQGPNMSPTSQGKNMPMTPENYPMVWPNWDPNLGVMAGFPEAPAWPNQMWFMPRDNGVWPQVPGYVPGMTQDMGGGPGYPPVGNPFGWMPMPEAPQMWLGEAEMPTDVTGPWTPKARQTIHSISSPVNLSEALQRRTKRSHTDPGRSVQLVFHGPYGGEQKATTSQTQTSQPRRPSCMEMGFALPSVPAVPDEKESPRMSRDTTMTPNTASNSLDSSKGDTREVPSRAVRFRQTITEVEVTTPYGIVYDGIKPMCFDFDRWGRKVYHFFPNEDDPGMEEVDGDND